MMDFIPFLVSSIPLLFALFGGFWKIMSLLIRIEHRLSCLEERFVSIGHEKNVILLRDTRRAAPLKKKKK